MDVQQLINCKQYCKPLEKNDMVKANSLLKFHFYDEVMEFMLANNCKLEQEIISWLYERNWYDCGADGCYCSVECYRLVTQNCMLLNPLFHIIIPIGELANQRTIILWIVQPTCKPPELHTIMKKCNGTGLVLKICETKNNVWKRCSLSIHNSIDNCIEIIWIKPDSASLSSKL